jgi:hypothetical protein
MTATSANGFPVLLTNRTTGSLPRLRKFVIPGTSRYLYLRDGSVGFLLVHFAMWWDRWVSRLDGGTWDEWGWAVRPIRGQTTGYSNHASGTAEDLDATQYPRGVPILRLFKPVTIAAIHRRLRLYGGVLGWGGDYHNTPDGMHVEVADGMTLAACERVARRLMDTKRGKAVLEANPGLRGVILS